MCGVSKHSPETVDDDDGAPNQNQGLRHPSSWLAAKEVLRCAGPLRARHTAPRLLWPWPGWFLGSVLRSWHHRLAHFVCSSHGYCRRKKPNNKSAVEEFRVVVNRILLAVLERRKKEKKKKKEIETERFYESLCVSVFLSP